VTKTYSALSPSSSQSTHMATGFSVVVDGPSNVIVIARRLGLALSAALDDLLVVYARDSSTDACACRLCRRLDVCRVTESVPGVCGGAPGPVNGSVIDDSSCDRDHRLCAFVTCPSFPSSAISRHPRHLLPWIS